MIEATMKEKVKELIVKNFKWIILLEVSLYLALSKISNLTYITIDDTL